MYLSYRGITHFYDCCASSNRKSVKFDSQFCIVKTISDLKIVYALFVSINSQSRESTSHSHVHSYPPLSLPSPDSQTRQGTEYPGDGTKLFQCMHTGCVLARVAVTGWKFLLNISNVTVKNLPFIRSIPLMKLSFPQGPQSAFFHAPHHSFILLYISRLCVSRYVVLLLQ